MTILNSLLRFSRSRSFGLVAIALLCLGPQAARAHSPVIDAEVTDWCFNELQGVAPDDSGGVLQCPIGTEVAWFDAEGDNTFINDLAVFATTSDATNLYFAATLYNDPDPGSLPSAQVAIDVAPGGRTEWEDTEGDLNAQAFGVNSTQTIGAEYLIIFDFGLYVLLGNDPTNTAQLYESITAPGSWTLITPITPAIDPGEAGGSGGPPGKVEIAIPWSDFSCAGCPSFGPDDAFRFTFMVAQGDTGLPFFTPSGPIEDLISEAIPGASTYTTNACPASAGNTSDCELADGSTDSFLGASQTPSGSVPSDTGPMEMDSPLLLAREANGDVTLTWDASCLAGDTDYGVYEGDLGVVGSQVPVVCTTGGATAATFAPAPGDNFYVISPNNANSEGSSGEDSKGNQRPTSAGECKVRVIGECP